MRSRQRKKPEKTNTFQEVLATIGGATFLLGLTFCVLYVVFPVWLDLPRVVANNPKELTGFVTLSKQTESSSRPISRSWGYPYYLQLDRKPFQSIIPLSEYEGKQVTIKYYPRIRVVVGVEVR